MKKTIKEYEGASETVTKIQCGNCDERWDHRGIRGKQGINTLVLDLRIEEKGRYSWEDGWKEERFGSMLLSGRTYRMNGDAINDFCHGCYDALFSAPLGVEVEETDYFVEETEVEQYLCDFCGDEMGEEADHEVSLNPRVKETKRIGIGGMDFNRVSKESRTKVLTREIRETFSTGRRRSQYEMDVDEQLDCCDSCADEIFGTSYSKSIAHRSADSGSNVLRNFGRTFQDLCVGIKDVMLLRPMR